jgi:hypothetical protein
MAVVSLQPVFGFGLGSRDRVRLEKVVLSTRQRSPYGFDKCLVNDELVCRNVSSEEV